VSALNIARSMMPLFPCEQLKPAWMHDLYVTEKDN
jgi:hypothetical protein